MLLPSASVALVLIFGLPCENSLSAVAEEGLLLNETKYMYKRKQETSAASSNKVRARNYACSGGKGNTRIRKEFPYNTTDYISSARNDEGNKRGTFNRCFLCKCLKPKNAFLFQ